jgi:hypothetical protein
LPEKEESECKKNLQTEASKQASSQSINQSINQSIPPSPRLASHACQYSALNAFSPPTVTERGIIKTRKKKNG